MQHMFFSFQNLLAASSTRQGVDYYITHKLETAYLIEHNSVKLLKGITSRLKAVESVFVMRYF
jgi:hypothetical protein